MKPSLALHKIPLYNTGRLDDDDIIAAFAARQGLFDRIAADLSAEKDGGRAQHHLIVGQRGMGKTMLLSRIAAEIRKTSLNERFVPLVFAEEQYAVDRLSKFWLNCLDSLADALERQGNPADAARIDDVVSGFTARFPSAAKDDSPLANEALTEFLNAAAEIGRRPVLLVDNLQLVFERISGQQQHALRELLMRPGSPILIGASPSPPPESQEYGAAFYDHFKVHYLRPLEVEEMQALMLHLAKVIGRDDVRARILSHPQRLKVLRQLTGGNPRTTATLFFLYAEDFAPTVFGDLENLLDRVTPLYKARFEELSAQQQVIASAIANHWDPVTSRTLSEVTGLPMTGISGQLDRLEKTGFIERVTLFGQSSTGYQIAERFFNVWFLMRSASRRQRREVEFLTRFLENFYETDDRSRIAKCLLDECNFSPDRHLFTKALAATLDDKAMAEDLERHAHLDALRQKAAEARRKLDEILDLSSLPPATLSFNELREKLMSLVPEGAGVTPEQFAEVVLCLLGRNEEARSALVEATAMCSDFADSWAFLGDVNSELGLIDESEKAYFQAAKFKTCSLQGLECLMSFYLDVHGDFSTSRQMIERARIQQDEVSVGYQSLHDSIFAAFDKDWGIAESAFCKALDWHVNDLSVVENSEWLRTSAWLIHLDYGEELLSLLEQRGDHVRFRPWYEALKAIQLGNRDYLLNIAPEIRTSAEALYDAIKERLDKLPESTRRRPLPKAAKKRGKRR